MNVVIKDEIIVGDSVLLNCADSARVLAVRDVDGCQIRLDGIVQSIEGEWCRVLIEIVDRGRGASAVMRTRLKDIDLCAGVNVWSQITAKSVDRVRQTGSEECDFWAPL